MSGRRAVLMAVMALPLAGCGSDDGEAADPATSGRAGQTLRISADPSGGLRFDVRRLNARAGVVTLTMDNPSAVPHAVAIKGKGLDVRGKSVGRGKVSTVTADLEPGTYSFYCPVGSHDVAGMRGPLRVR